jgi:hypothetical protein
MTCPHLDAHTAFAHVATLLTEDAERVLKAVTWSGDAWYQKGSAHFHLKEYSAAVCAICCPPSCIVAVAQDHKKKLGSGTQGITASGGTTVIF